MLTVRKDDSTLIYALIAQNNQRMLDDVSTTKPHKAKSGTTTGDFKAPTFAVLAAASANATNLATSLTLVNELKSVVNRHFADVPPHNTSTSAQVTTASGTDLTTAVALANQLKSVLNTHETSTSVHYNSDTTNTITNANATDQTTLNTLINEMKTKLNAHIATAPSGLYVNLKDA